ncbi:PRD domain-containing protein [Caproiciproducens galactitolivorans]|uniref:Transcriptional regulator ManR n=1 Tax=Caproiciproducens galactitolivorans TaxID=642589 RepID=A0A4Z0YCK8_9FIRM|nr:PTS sugar transporter subunit IIA [Caproiciproducens galactitolivorans]QEY34868.1 PRD domain-containing protein [Caproiciproducens galactitolivorans]TGJ75576.1 transcriptional regulator ManR [Caproiciproducens galactitolivorans]
MFSKISRREREIINLLHQQDEYVTVQFIANKIHYSEKTVRNDLKKISNYLSHAGLGEISAKPKKGVKLTVTFDQWEKLQSSVRQFEFVPLADVFTEERKYQICLMLLQNRSMSVADLAKRLYLSRTSIESALVQAEKWFKKHSLSLKRIRGKGLVIEGSDLSIRLAMLELFQIFKLKQDKSRVSVKFGSDAYVINLIAKFLNGFQADGVIRCVKETEREFGFNFEYHSRYPLFFLISFSLYCCRLKRQYSASFGNPEISVFNRQVTNFLITQLEKCYRMKIPDGEKNYLLLCLSAAHIEKFEDTEKYEFCKSTEIQFYNLVQQFVNLTAKIANTDISSDEILLKDAFLYLRSAIVRMWCKVRVPNPFLEQIKREYRNVFAVVWLSSTLLESELKVEISENEVASLTISVVSAIARAVSKIKIYIICNYGIGFSRLLRQQIERQIPEVVVEGIATVAEAQKIKNSGCDFVVAPEDLGGRFGGKEVIKVDNFLKTYDIKNIQKKAFQIRCQKGQDLVGTKEVEHAMIFDGKFVYFLDNILDKTELLKKMCSHLEKGGYVSEGFIQSVLYREKSSSTEFGWGVALPHGDVKYVIQPIISVAVLKQPIKWDNVDEVDTIFLLALDSNSAANNLQVKNFYTILSTMTDSSDVLEKGKEMLDEQKFADYMNALTK